MKRACIFIAAMLCLFAVAPAFAKDSVELSLTPKVLDIDAFYNGATLTATGTAPADSNVILRFMGATCDLHMKERGKVFGIMWMNLDSLTFRGVPSVCLVSSALDFASFTDSADQEQQSTIKALRLSGIRDVAGIEPKGLDQTKAFNELLKLKQSEGLYKEVIRQLKNSKRRLSATFRVGRKVDQPWFSCPEDRVPSSAAILGNRVLQLPQKVIGNISYGPTSDGSKSFKAKIPIPSRLTPGAYLVELVAISKGKIIAKAQEPITVNLVGFPAMLSQLAFGHSALYGILATVIALLAGLAIGMVFQSKGAH